MRIADRHAPISKSRHEGMMWLSIHDLAEIDHINVWEHSERAFTLSLRVTNSEWSRVWPILRNVEDVKKREELFQKSAHRAAQVFVNVLKQEIA